MKFQLVPIHATGPLTFQCSGCDVKVQQAEVDCFDKDGHAKYAWGPVWADLDGPAFKAYYCTRCKEAALRWRGLI